MFFLILLILIIVCIIRCIVIVPQGFVYITELLGRYKSTLTPGLHLLVPVFETVARKVDMKEQVGDFEAIEAITKDNVMLRVDSVVFYKVKNTREDPKKYTYGVSNPEHALQLLTATTLRNVIGEMTLDESLTSRERINESMQHVLDEATDAWGILVRRVELKSLEPGSDVRIAMEKQVTAERMKRAEILEAEAHKQADILKAEGHKEAMILDAQAEKERKILEAEAEEESQIHRAKGRAEAIRMVQEAEANGIQALNDSRPSEAVLKLKGYDALAKVADGNATKIILPAELTNIAAGAEVVGEMLESSKERANTKVVHQPAKTTSDQELEKDHKEVIDKENVKVTTKHII